MVTARTPKANMTPVIETDVKRLSRREFLTFLWGASAGLLVAGSCGAAMWFALPKSRLGVDVFQVDLSEIPAPGSDPVPFVKGNFWMSSSNGGLVAFWGLCVV